MLWNQTRPPQTHPETKLSLTNAHKHICLCMHKMCRPPHTHANIIKYKWKQSYNVCLYTADIRDFLFYLLEDIFCPFFVQLLWGWHQWSYKTYFNKHILSRNKYPTKYQMENVSNRYSWSPDCNVYIDPIGPVLLAGQMVMYIVKYCRNTMSLENQVFRRLFFFLSVKCPMSHCNVS